MKVCLDTNAYSDWVRNLRWSEELQKATRVLLPVVVLGELREGFLGGSWRAKNEDRMREILAHPNVEVVQLSEETSALYAELKNYLRTQGTPLPTNDIWIAASALEQGAVLLTSNKHFEKLPQVRVRWPS